jgi:hypothetical protein
MACESKGAFRFLLVSWMTATLAAMPMVGRAQDDRHVRHPVIVSSNHIQAGGADVQVDFAAGELDVSTNEVLHWIQTAVHSVVVYYGRFPVSRARILVVPESGEKGILQGTTWGDMDGFPGFTRIRLGQHSTVKDLSDDWTMTHELVHMAFPSMPESEHWIEEGLATYIEPVARVQAGNLEAQQIWSDMMDGMPKGEPKANDLGLDRTHTWGRTYWGGALFCLVADVEIRKQTGNRMGLQNAMRAIVAQGGTIDRNWELKQALDIGDRATGTGVLTKMYAEWGMTPVQVDLDRLWSELGVHREGSNVVFDLKAPLAKIGESITAPAPDRVERGAPQHVQ